MPAANGEARFPLAQSFVEYVQSSDSFPFVTIDKVDSTGLFDIVDATFEPQLEQMRTVPIADREPIRILFTPDDADAPHVFSLRADFPTDQVHTFQSPVNDSVVLCVWEENWDDLRRTLTGYALAERIRRWLSLAASGRLHQADQPLEPMLARTAPTLIVPPGPFPDACSMAQLDDQHGIYVAMLDGEQRFGKAIPLPVFALEVAPQVHGGLQARPSRLQALHEYLAPFGADLLGTLGDWLFTQLEQGERLIVMLVTFPKIREAGGPVEEWERWAFIPRLNIENLLVRLGLAERDPDSGKLGKLLVPAAVDPPDEVLLPGARVVPRLDREEARRFSGAAGDADVSIVAIGAGAIGSNVIVNSVRAGIGTWTIIDDDIVLPHNTVRQVHGDDLVGRSKAEATAALVRVTLAEDSARSIRANFLRPGDLQGEVDQALSEATLVVDFSASPAVVAALGANDTINRAASFFFNPEANDLVILVEPEDRALRLDEIEAQYFLAVATSRRFAQHLASARTDFVRYANACQDLTRPVPPWRVQTFCGVAAGQLVGIPKHAEARAQIWSMHPDTGCILTAKLPLEPVRRHSTAEFRVTVAESVMETMRALRQRNLPAETGGIVVGTVDVHRRTIHVLAALPAPTDSQQSPTHFVRGVKDLKPIVDGMAQRSAGAITYLGEWHSHPDRAVAEPSDDDEDVFAYLRTHLGPTGSPYVMAICGVERTWLRVEWRGATDEVVFPHA